MSRFGRKKAPIDFSSYSFPPPPPEAENWQPDPDSIPLPGSLPDLRLNKKSLDPRWGAFKREAMKADRLATASPSPSSNGSEMRSLGSWPIPLARQTGLPGDMTRVEGSALTPAQDPITEPVSEKASGVVSLGGGIATTAARMETMPRGAARHPLTQGKLTSSPNTVLPTKGSVPDWTKKMDKALSEYVKPTNTPSVSIPPHLRKRAGKSSCNTELNPAAAATGFKSPPATDVQADIKSQKLADIVQAEDNLQDEVVAWQLAADEEGAGCEKDALKLQQDLLNKGNSSKANAPKHRPAYDQKEMAMLVRMMEHELDLGKVATMSELLAMSMSDIENYYSKVRSAHKNWWEANQAA